MVVVDIKHQHSMPALTKIIPDARHSNIEVMPNRSGAFGSVLTICVKSKLDGDNECQKCGKQSHIQRKIIHEIKS